MKEIDKTKGKIADPPERKLVGKAVLPFLILILAFVLTAFFSYQVYRIERQTSEERFGDLMDLVKLSILNRMGNYEQVLKGGEGLFVASNEVTKSEWKSYVDAQKIPARFPGIQGVGYSAFIGGADKVEPFLAKLNQEGGFGNFTIKPPVGDRQEYHTIIYLEPLDERNLQAVGYDMFSEKNRRDAMSRSRAEDATTMSGKVILVQEIDEDVQAGFLIYIPVYQKGAPISTKEQRILAFKGFVYSPFRMNDFMAGLLPESIGRDLDFEIYDLSEEEDNIMYDYSLANKFSEEPYHSKFQKREVLEVFGRQWVIVFHERSSFLDFWAGNLFWIVLVTGVIFSLLLFGIFYMSFNSFRVRVGGMVDVMEKITKGNFNIEIDTKTLEKKDELGKLARSINRILSSMKLAVLRAGVAKEEMGIGEALAAKQKAETEKTEVEALLKDIMVTFDNSTIIALTDKEGTITYVNDKFIEVSKYSREELIGENHRILKSGFHSKGFYEKLWKTISSGKVWRGNIRNKDKGGEIYWIRGVIMPRFDKKGSIAGYVAARTIVTDLMKSYENAIAKLNRGEKIDPKMSKIIGELKNGNYKLCKGMGKMISDVKKEYVLPMEKKIESNDSKPVKKINTKQKVAKVKSLEDNKKYFLKRK